MFEDCGWEYIRDFCDCSYFRKPTEDEYSVRREPLCPELRAAHSVQRATPEYSEENVDESRLVMIKRVMIGRGPFLLVFILTLIPQFAHYSFSADSFEQFIFWLDMVLTIIVASVIGYVCFQYYQIYQEIKKK